MSSDKLTAIRATAGGAQLATMADYWTMAQAIVSAGMAPMLNAKTGERMTSAQVMIAIQAGAEVGLPPMAALKNFAIIGNRPTLWGDAIMALIHRSGELAEWDEGVTGDSVDRHGYCFMRRTNGIHARNTFSVADAKLANLWGKTGPWTNYPDRMLRMRARGFTARDVFADKIGGYIMTEEAMDIPTLTATDRPAAGSAGLLAALTAPPDEPAGEGVPEDVWDEVMKEGAR